MAPQKVNQHTHTQRERGRRRIGLKEDRNKSHFSAFAAHTHTHSHRDSASTARHLDSWFMRKNGIGYIGHGDKTIIVMLASIWRQHKDRNSSMFLSPSELYLTIFINLPLKKLKLTLKCNCQFLPNRFLLQLAFLLWNLKIVNNLRTLNYFTIPLS